MTGAADPGAQVGGVLGFSILGRRFEARGASADMAEWLRNAWYFPEHDRHVPAGDYGIVLNMADVPPDDLRDDRDGSDDVEPSASDVLAIIAPGWRGEGDVWETGTRAAGLRFALAPHEARIRVWGENGASTVVELMAALHVALCEALRASGLLPLHAAVALRDGRATAFVAASGTGKSTTLIRAVRAGWHPVAEDFAWLDPETLVVYGWDRGVRLWPEGHALIGDAAGGGWRMGVDGKLLLDYTALGAGAAARRGVLSRLSLLMRDGAGAPGWEPLAARDAVRALWEATGVPLSPRNRERVARQMPELLARVEARRLRLGDTPVSL